MGYIGSSQGSKAPVLLDSISVVNGQAAYTLQKNSVNYSPSSELTLQVSLNGLIQEPSNSYSISGSTITFAENLVTGDVIDYILDREPTTGTMEPLDASVTADKMASSILRNVQGQWCHLVDKHHDSIIRTSDGRWHVYNRIWVTLTVNGEMSIVKLLVNELVEDCWQQNIMPQGGLFRFSTQFTGINSVTITGSTVLTDLTVNIIAWSLRYDA